MTERADLGLAWGVKDSFLAYVERIGDAMFQVGDGAAVTSHGEVYFPFLEHAEGRLRFGGGLRIAAHFGALDLHLHDIAVEVTASPRLTVAGTRDGARLALLDLVLPEPVDDGGVRMWPVAGARLAAEAVHLFGGVYPPGEPFAPVTIRIPRPADD